MVNGRRVYFISKGWADVYKILQNVPSFFSRMFSNQVLELMLFQACSSSNFSPRSEQPYVELTPVCVCSIQYMRPMHLMRIQGVISQDWHMLWILHLFYTYEDFFWQVQVIGLLFAAMLEMWVFHLRSDVSINRPMSLILIPAKVHYNYCW